VLRSGFLTMGRMLPAALALSVLFAVSLGAYLLLRPGDDDGLSLACRGPTSEVTSGGTISAVLREGGRPVGDREVSWTLLQGKGALLDPSLRSAGVSRTNPAGEASVNYLLPQDLGWEGDVRVRAEARGVAGLADCEVRFRERSLGLPTPRPATPRP